MQDNDPLCSSRCKPVFGVGGAYVARVKVALMSVIQVYLELTVLKGKLWRGHLCLVISRLSFFRLMDADKSIIEYERKLLLIETQP